LAVAVMMRRLAWCGISQSIVGLVEPLAARVSSTTASSVFTATLNTSLPVIARARHGWARRLESRRDADRVPQQFLVAAVGVQVGGGRRSSESALSTTAPAPSPNSTQVPRSVQSSMRDRVSAPITSAVARAGTDEIVGHA
jgi:hypothetical protein